MTTMPHRLAYVMLVGMFVLRRRWEGWPSWGWGVLQWRRGAGLEHDQEYRLSESQPTSCCCCCFFF